MTIHDFKFGTGSQDNLQSLYDHYYNSSCTIGTVTAIDVISQTISVKVDGCNKYDAVIPMANMLGYGPCGSATPSLNDAIILAKHQGQLFCLATVPNFGKELTEPGVRSLLEKKDEKTGKKIYENVPLAPHQFGMIDKKKYSSISRDAVISSYYDARSKKELSEAFKFWIKGNSNKALFEDEKMPQDPTSPLTGRFITFPKDAVIYGSDSGSKLVGLNDGRIAIIGGPFCHSTWNKENNLLNEVMLHRQFHHGGGFSIWSSDFKKLQSSIQHELWMQPDNLDGRRIVSLFGSAAKNDRMSVTRVERNTAIYRLTNKELIEKLKKQDFTAAGGGQIDPLALMSSNKWNEEESASEGKFFGTVGKELETNLAKKDKNIPVWQFQVDDNGLPKLIVYKEEKPEDTKDKDSKIPRVEAETNSNYIECLTIEIDGSGKLSIVTRSEINMLAKNNVAITSEGSVSVTANKELSIDCKENASINVKKDININAGKNISVNTKEPVNITLNGGAIVDSKKDLKFSSDKNIIMSPKGNFTVLSGGKTEVTSKENVTIKGKKVEIIPPIFDKQAILNEAKQQAQKMDKEVLSEAKKSTTAALSTALKNDASVLSAAKSYTDTKTAKK